MEQETLDMLNASKGEEAEKTKELKHHNLVMEKPVEIQAKTMEMEFKMQLLKNYNILKREGLNTSQIIQVFPDMKVFCFEN